MPGIPGARTGLATILTGDAATAFRTTINSVIGWIESNAAITSAGLFSARPTSSPGTPGIAGRRYHATDAFATFRDTGTGWELESQTPHVVTALPTSGGGIPFDGQEVYFLADATNGLRWHCRYDAASTKWSVMGGPPLVAEVTAAETLGTTSYTNLATIGPSITLPANGDYLVTISASTFGTLNTQANSMSYAIGATAAQDADRALIEVNGNTPLTQFMSRTRSKTGLTVGQALVAKYAVAAGGTATFLNRYMSIAPRRIW
jgi:hypothetical protein